MKTVNIMNLKIGNIVHFHCARFEITSTKIVIAKGINEIKDAQRDTVMIAKGQWIDGKQVKGYFGRDTDWIFQGNSNVSHSVE